MDALQSIRKPIEKDMERYRQLFDSLLQHSNPILSRVLPLMSKRRGKMMRPMLTLLSAKLGGDVNQSTIYSAAAFEFFHTASLLHDDVVDESDERRGETSINNAFGNKVAVLVGDYLLSNSLQCAAMSQSLRLVHIISKAAQDLADGELLQLNNITLVDLSEDVYYTIIKNKTAALFSSCAEAGIMSVSSDEMAISAMRQFGEMVGMCFQIRDDIFDYCHDTTIGKPTGIDMKEGKFTLPVLYALQHTNDKEILSIVRNIKQGNPTEKEISQLVEYTISSGGIDYATQVMNNMADKAKELLNPFPDSDVKQSLIKYVDFVVDRTS